MSNGKAMADFSAWMAKRRWVLKLSTALHIGMYRLTSGGMGGLAMGLPILLLTHTGRKSGKRFTTPLGWLQEGDAYAVVASFAGSPKDPAWWSNLQAGPGSVQIGDKHFRVRAEQASPEVRDRLYAAFTRLYPAFEEYQKRTDRHIPVVLLYPNID